VSDNSSKIHLNYRALSNQTATDHAIPDALVKKAQGWFGGKARDQIERLMGPDIRLLSVEVAKRQCNPMNLYAAGLDGLAEAIKKYRIGKTEGSFNDFARKQIRIAMQRAKQKM
jgi:hypothetical protein